MAPRMGTGWRYLGNPGDGIHRAQIPPRAAPRDNGHTTALAPQRHSPTTADAAWPLLWPVATSGRRQPSARWPRHGVHQPQKAPWKLGSAQECSGALTGLVMAHAMHQQPAIHRGRCAALVGFRVSRYTASQSSTPPSGSSVASAANTSASGGHVHAHPNHTHTPSFILRSRAVLVSAADNVAFHCRGSTADPQALRQFVPTGLTMAGAHGTAGVNIQPGRRQRGPRSCRSWKH